MAARRLLIVMLVLLGISTLAAALVPQHDLRGTNGTTSTTTTNREPTTTTAPAPAGRQLYEPIRISAKKAPVVVVAGPICPPKHKPKCQPGIHVGDQLSLSVYTDKGQSQVSVPAFGLLGVASSNTPAMFQLLFDQPDPYGVVVTPSQRVVAKIEVLKTKAAEAESRRANAKRRAHAGRGRPR